MASVNALRALLVGGAIVAGIVAAVSGLWLTAAVMAVAVGVHGVLTVRLRSHPAAPPAVTPPSGAPPAATDSL